MGKRGRKPVYREITCPSCGSNHVVKKGRVRGKQEYLCRNCGRQFLEGAKHRYDESVREKALEMYSNGVSMRAISRVLKVPLGTVFTWIKRYGKRKYEKLTELWSKAKDVVGEGVKVVDEMWTYLNKKAFYRWVFTGFLFSTKGMYVSFSVGNRDEKTFNELRQYPPEKGTWVTDNYNLYFLLPQHTVVSPVNPNESLHLSLRDRLVRGLPRQLIGA